VAWLGDVIRSSEGMPRDRARASMTAAYSILCMYRFGSAGESLSAGSRKARLPCDISPNRRVGAFYACMVTDENSAQRASYRLECGAMYRVHK
jgi:hypothetical protein